MQHSLHRFQKWFPADFEGKCGGGGSMASTKAVRGQGGHNCEGIKSKAHEVDCNHTSGTGCLKSLPKSTSLSGFSPLLNRNSIPEQANLS